MKTSIALAMVVVLFATPSAYPWGNEGHEIVARIAARNLSDAARSQIVALLRGAVIDDLNLKAVVGHEGDPQPSTDAVEQALATIATWPDHMPGGKGATAPWHFVDIGLFEGPSHLSERCGTGCVSQKIAQIRDNLKSNMPLNSLSPDKELRFLVHFVGDIHQPLHTVTNADAGGNCEKITGFSGSHVLHSAWDTALVREVMSEDEDIEAAIITEFTPVRSTVESVIDPDKMAAESFGLAKTVV